MRPWGGLAVLALPCILVSLDAEVLNLAAPQLTADLRPSSVQLLWIMDSYVFVVAGALIAMGVLGDRIGRRRLLLGGAAAFGAASLLAAFATTPGQLIAARVLMGLSGASLMPSTLALIRVMFTDPRHRSAAMGVWSASFALGGVASPLVGGVLLTHFWWGSVFLIAVPAVLLLLLLGPALLPESRDHGASTFDVLGAALSLAAVLLFVYGLKRLAATGWHPLPAAVIALSAGLGWLFLRRQRRIDHPLLDLAMFRNARVAVALGGNALSFFVLYGTQLAITLHLQLILGMSPLRAGMWILPSVLAYLGASFLGPALARRFPPGRVVTVGLVVMAAGFLVMAGGGLAAVVAGTVIYSLGLAPVYILTTELVVATVRPARAGMAAAVTETGCELGGALGIALLGSLTVVVFRQGMADAGSSGYVLPPGGTLSDVVAAAANLPQAAAGELVRQAVAAFGAAFSVMALAAAALAAVAAVLTGLVLRPVADLRGGRGFRALPGQPLRVEPSRALPGQPLRVEPPRALPGQPSRVEPSRALPGQPSRSQPSRALPAWPTRAVAAEPPRALPAPPSRSLTARALLALPSRARLAAAPRELPVAPPRWSEDDSVGPTGRLEVSAFHGQPTHAEFRGPIDRGPADPASADELTVRLGWTSSPVANTATANTTADTTATANAAAITANAITAAASAAGANAAATTANAIATGATANAATAAVTVPATNANAVRANAATNANAVRANAATNANAVYPSATVNGAPATVTATNAPIATTTNAAPTSAGAPDDHVLSPCVARHHPSS
jgi:MFS transporter, DHA2 family, multidrug resistance protein